MADMSFDYDKYVTENGGSVHVDFHVGGSALKARFHSSGAVSVSGMAEGMSMFFASRRQMRRIGDALLDIVDVVGDDKRSFTVGLARDASDREVKREFEELAG